MSVWRAGAHAPPLVVGHRGGRGEGWPLENSMEAFERARREGAAAVETDTRLDEAGRVILRHDPAPLPSEAERGGPATLEELLAWASDCGVAVNVELKSDVPARLPLARAVARAVRRRRAAEVDVIFSSFDPRLMVAMAALLPRVPRACLVTPKRAALARRIADVARPPLAQALHPDRTQVDAALVGRMKRRGVAVGVYTVNDPEEGRRLARLGVDWLFTDAPGAMREALASDAAIRPANAAVS